MKRDINSSFANSVLIKHKLEYSNQILSIREKVMSTY